MQKPNANTEGQKYITEVSVVDWDKIEWMKMNEKNDRNFRNFNCGTLNHLSKVIYSSGNDISVNIYCLRKLNQIAREQQNVSRLDEFN